MSDPTIVIVATSVQAVLLAIITGVFKIWTDRNHADSVTRFQNVTGEIVELKKNTDGKLTELKNALVGQATAEGDLVGQAKVRAEIKEEKAAVSAPALAVPAAAPRAPHIIDPSSIPVSRQLDSIDKTGIDTNQKVDVIKKVVADEKEAQVPIIKAVINSEKAKE